MRPSETEPGGYAIVFRTKTEMKRWKIVCQDGQYMVYPRPQKYPSLENVVEVRHNIYTSIRIINTVTVILGVYKRYQRSLRLRHGAA